MRWRDLAALGVALLGISAAAIAIQASGLRVQHSASLPMGLYWELRGARPTRGAIGVFCLPLETARWARARGYIARGDCPGDAEPIGKVVLAIGSDTIDFGRDGVVLNGRRVAGSAALKRDARGRVLVAAPFRRYVLAQDQVWLWSPYSARSFDSRYFGPLPTGALVGVVRAVWTLDP